MKKIFKISAIIAIPILCVVIFTTLLVSSAILRNMSTHIVGQYSISCDNFLEKCYNDQSKTGIAYDDGVYIKKYTYNEQFILLDTWKRKDNCIHYENPWFIAKTEGRIEMLKCYYPALYIIDVKQDSIYGSMDIKEYVEMREKLGVPDDMTLKVKLKI